MFNSEIKERFIKDYTTKISMRRVCAVIFNTFEKYEVAWGADLCTKSADDLRQIVNDVAGGTRGRSQLRLVILRNYVKWCIENKIAGACDGMLNVKISAVEMMKKQTVTSPLHLQIYLDIICDPESEETTDNIYRCFYWLAYSGIGEHDIVNVKISDVNLSSMLIRYNGKDFPVYREALPAFKNCMRLTRFVYNHPNYTTGKTAYKSRPDGDTLMRGVLSGPSTKALIVGASRRSKDALEQGKTNLKMSYFRVWLSGLFYRMYERERAGIPVDFSAAAAQFMEGKAYNPTYQKKVARDYCNDYETWKMTF